MTRPAAARPPLRERPAHRCGDCGATVPKWVGQCPQCRAWGSIVESTALRLSPGLRTAATGSAPVRPARALSELTEGTTPRQRTGLAEFDRVLGGGLVAGQVVLLAGEPGVGKTTLLSTAAHTAARTMAAGDEPATVLYVSGEESVEQISVRAQRIGAVGPGILVADETDLASVLGHLEAHDPALLIVDSVQALASAAVEGRAGGMAQVQEVTAVLTRAAKARRMPLLLIGQSTRENAVAGPRALEHMVDTVLTFEGDRHTSLRLLRAVKNRFGPTDEVVCFEQADDGLREVLDPSDLFRSHRSAPVPGNCVAITVEGRRAMPAEVQALVAPANPQAHPRRGVTGLDSARVAMLIAVTERYSDVPLARSDIFVATVGGARLSDPSTDLAVCLALASSATSAAVPFDVVVMGEVGLSGDIRPVGMLAQRVSEAARLGYRRVLVPRGSRSRLPAPPAGVTVSEVDRLDRAVDIMRHQAVVRPLRSSL